jgi:hypothetical protein
VNPVVGFISGAVLRLEKKKRGLGCLVDVAERVVVAPADEPDIPPL